MSPRPASVDSLLPAFAFYPFPTLYTLPSIGFPCHPQVSYRPEVSVFRTAGKAMVQYRNHMLSKCTVSFVMAYSHSISDTVTSALFQHVDSGGYEYPRFLRYPEEK
ncbi:hypothetical protein BPAE_0082g00270 [Botrytis paeoniae]|uniref:Uncharacterized protein n=1 Tax=Botrytis paeoniae TaxID=278948 RepID=A0A4Z1FR32_9HELO|nr:hypothetical protein BPAE_0082g00270 [Botrytis paeoniae]